MAQMGEPIVADAVHTPAGLRGGMLEGWHPTGRRSREEGTLKPVFDPEGVITVDRTGAKDDQ